MQTHDDHLDDLPLTDEFVYPPRFVEVHGSRMHYIEEGPAKCDENAPVVLFIHGMPTWSYLWRNIIPRISPLCRCIAVDLIGMGRSEKPEIGYHLQDHIHYLEGFVEALGLKNLVLMMHAWGSAIGFEYARLHEENIKGLAFLEAHLRPPQSWDMVSLPVQELSSVLNMEDGGYDIVMNSNYFVNKVLPRGVLRTLTEKEMLYYREPFTRPGSCFPLWQYLQEVPVYQNDCSKVVDTISQYSSWLQVTSLPKLMLYAIPGFITVVPTIQWARDHLRNASVVDVGEALHYAQETNPKRIAFELRTWLETVFFGK